MYNDLYDIRKAFVNSFRNFRCKNIFVVCVNHENKNLYIYIFYNE